MFRPNWPSSGVYWVRLLLFAAMRVLLRRTQVSYLGCALFMVFYVAVLCVLANTIATSTLYKITPSFSSPQCLVTASNNGKYSAPALRSSLKGGSLPSELFFLQLSFL
jgi:hypothetical protein